MLFRNNNNSFGNEVKQFQDQAEYTRDEALEKLQQFISKKRLKRGLIDPLGSLIKVITGNLDHEDAVHFEKLISDLKTREQATSNKITIISEMLDHVVNSTKIINDNTKILNDRLTKIERFVKAKFQEENHSIALSYIINIFNLFIINFRTISIKLSEIETSLALSKVSVLHKSVLNPNELLPLLTDISTVAHLMYPVNEQNLNNLEETFTVKSYLKDSNVRFIISIPIVDNVTYDYYKLYTLPISHGPSNETHAIIPKFPYLLVEGTRYSPIVRKCKEITAKEYLCLENDLAVYAEETCIQQLMEYRQNRSKCHARRIDPDFMKVQKISRNSWILFAKSEKILFQKCGDEVIREPVKGTFIISIQKPCDVYIDDFPIYGHRFRSLGNNYYKRTPIINLPDVQEYEKKSHTEDTEVVDLKGVNLDDIEHLNYLLKKNVKSDNSVNPLKSYGIATIVLYLVITLIIVFLIYFKFKPYIFKLCSNNQINSNDEIELQRPTTNRPLLSR